MGGDQPHQENPGGFLPPDCDVDHGEVTLTKIQWSFQVPTSGRGDVGGGVGGTRNSYFHNSEHGGPVHRKCAHTRPVPGIGEADMSAGETDVLIEKEGIDFMGTWEATEAEYTGETEECGENEVGNEAEGITQQ